LGPILLCFAGANMGQKIIKTTTRRADMGFLARVWRKLIRSLAGQSSGAGIPSSGSRADRRKDRRSRGERHK